MNHFDRIDRDAATSRIQSGIFDYVHSAGPARVQAHVDDRVRALRSAYLAAYAHAVKSHLRQVGHYWLARLQTRHDCANRG